MGLNNAIMGNILDALKVSMFRCLFLPLPFHVQVKSIRWLDDKEKNKPRNTIGSPTINDSVL